MDGTDQRAKEPLSAALAGPYGHPFHPILVTVPIGAWLSSVVFDVASTIAGPGDALSTGARWLIAIGVLGALAAATVGFLDFLVIPTGTPAHRTALVHAALNVAVTAAFAGDFVWRLQQPHGATPVGPLVLSLVAVAGLAVSGTLGGRLSYRYGVRVAADRVQATGFTAPETSGRRAARRDPTAKGA